VKYNVFFTHSLENTFNYGKFAILEEHHGVLLMECIAMTEERDPRDILDAWVKARGCSVTWVAQQVGWSREMLSQVINKQQRMSKKLARDLREKLGIPVEGQPRLPPEESPDPRPQRRRRRQENTEVGV
jgi:hypothetical protein